MKNLLFAGARLHSTIGDVGLLSGRAACLSAFAEVLGGVALAAGFLTPLAPLLIAINLSVAGFVRHAVDPYARKELAFLCRK